MRILIVCRSFYPEISPRSFRATELAKEFARQGHEVTVCLSQKNNDYTALKNEYGIIFKFMPPVKWKSVPIIEKGILHWPSRAIRRLLQLMLEYPDIELMFKVKRVLKKEKGYDLLISIAVPYPIHWGVAMACSKKHRIATIWVADCGDPYMGVQTDSFKKMFYFKYLEKWFMKKADYISIPVETARQGYFNEFHYKIKVIPQGFKFQNEKRNANIQINPIPTFAYAGNFVPGQKDPSEFLEFLSSINKQFKFYVFTSTKALVKKYQGMLNSKLIINDIIPREELLDFLSSVDFVVNFDYNTTVQIPSKLIDYAIVGKPILNVKKTLDKVTIMEFLNGDYKNAYKIDNIEQYRIENVCKAFLTLIPS